MKKCLYKNYIDTPIGQMISISDAQFLYRLDFTEHKNLQAKIARLNAIILEHPTPISCQLEEELQEYFARKRKSFKLPLAVQGTEFQQKVWKKVEEIPFGQTRTYKEIAQGLAHLQASIAVGAANAANPFAIVIPCHRLKKSSGQLAGYTGGLWRKEWLLDFEENNTYVE
ncbi:methylated-DNA--[protein]-cysteine S-methyltransferase [Lactococcus petauri]|uniref:methylated-DNA--[protein]-cysteine S-methyltransferase n=1 Tax=Lactococcus petauri TaxID=1940789 RepID=UPI0013FDCDBD|nr:methylated-DNA--[protein]-cysteine S-methyltransferase [Lactococcus petauri]NHI76649.1 methylated-DNA--[protein]-cysteine S-methyltransferase [Lactococcus petauri]